MLHVAISQLTTSRWELPEEIARVADHGFDCMSLWRAKLSDIGPAAAASLLADAGIRVSSLQWAGGFTGGDGRTFAESIDDAAEAIETAATVGAPTLVIHSGCRGGHTRPHARRLLVQALQTLAPIAGAAGVTLAVKPMHLASAAGCSFLNRPVDALELVENVADPAIRMALDLWQFGDDPDLVRLLPRLAAATAVVQVADRNGPPTVELERLPASHGSLPLESLVLALIDHGYAGDFELDPVGDAVASLGYEGVLAETRRVADAWAVAVEERLLWSRATAAVWQTAGSRLAAASAAGNAINQRLWPAGWMTPWSVGWSNGQFRSMGSRRSHASSQTVSRG
jgi:sugar phosphate isomerase/epimerase